MNGFDLSTISSVFVGSNKYSAIYKGSTLIFRDYSAEYLTFESLEDNNVIGWKKSASNAPTGTIQYSTDKTTWTSVTPDTTGVTLATLNTGDKLYLKGDNNAYGNFPSNTNRWINFTSTKTFNMYGNIMSLINSTNFKTMTTLPAVTRIFSNIFLATKVVDASNLILPVANINQTVAYYCMFKNCTSLTTAPKLPATKLSSYCYNFMFQGCTSLTTVPELPATTLATYCYQGMFQGCTSLTSVPSDLLSATTLTTSCYQGMFQDCTNLTTVPELPATTLASSCYRGMFQGCTSITIIPSNLLPVTTLKDNCYRGMFQDCTSLTTAPALPATTLTGSCYLQMFYGCSSLVNAPIISATTLADTCCSQMFRNCTSLETAPTLPALTLTTQCYFQMFNGCSKLNYVKMLATDISASNCMYNWLNDVSSTGTFVKNSAATWTKTGVSGIPNGWTVQDAA